MPFVKEVCHEVNGDNTIKTSHGTSKEKRIVISIKHKKVQFYKHVPKQLKTLFLLVEKDSYLIIFGKF